MAQLLALDIGSSSVIAGFLRGKKVIKEAPRVFFKSHCQGSHVEVNSRELLAAVAKAVAALQPLPGSLDAIHLAVMCPAWVVMDAQGNSLTPIVTHQDRRSVCQAHEIEKIIGAKRHLKITGCRPFPGGISSTTWAWFKKNAPERLKRADLLGHLNTFIHRHLTGARVIDPSNASFTGLYETVEQKGWSGEICDALGVPLSLLPEIKEADIVAGRLNRSGARLLGLPEGVPVMTGLMDGSAGMLLAGATPGQLFNVCGSTDVLALCTDKPRPHPRLLTRAVGVGRQWLAVSTLAAAASSIYWARDQFFSEMAAPDFIKEVHRLSRIGITASGGVTFDPYMAGERTNIDQRQGGFSGITLATTREHLLSAIIESLVRASAERLPLLREVGTLLLPTVAVSGGADRLDKIFHRDWVGDWKFRSVTDATMLGLATMSPRFEG